MFALGRLFNVGVSATTADVRFNLKKASSVAIIAVGATSGAVTVSESNAASSGTEQALPRITSYWRQNNGVWTQVTQAAGSTFTCGTGGLAVCEIEATWLSDGFNYISASHSSATMLILPIGLYTQRKPSLMPDLRA